MGHVDHGKTSLLDAIRETEVAAGEAGGITQHIGAYQVHHDGNTITFLDTPGHQAFTAMRARGAKVTDIAVIVVAADDGVMPQTVEALDHAKAADVPILIAVNKIDKEGADPNRVRGELANQGLTPADWGGDTEFVDVSAKTKQNLPDLLETIVTVAELEELKANPDAEASGTVIESRLDPGRGPVVSLLVDRGTLKVGDALVAGAHWGRVRAMHDYRGERVNEATPGHAGRAARLRRRARGRRARAGRRERAQGAPARGRARRTGSRPSRSRAARACASRSRTSSSARRRASWPSCRWSSRPTSPARSRRSPTRSRSCRSSRSRSRPCATAWAASPSPTSCSPRPRTRSSSASTSARSGDARAAADREGVEIRTYTVIYKIVEELRNSMEGLLVPEEVEQTIATAEVRQTFKASRVGTIAGCFVASGTVRRGAQVRLVRDGTIIHDGRIGSLRRFQNDVAEVTEGQECGIVLENYPDVKEGDVLEVYETKQVERELE